MPRHVALIAEKLSPQHPFTVPTLRLANHLAERGCRVTLLSPMAVDHPLNEGVTVKSRGKASRLRLVDRIRYRRWVARTGLDEQPDLTISLASSIPGDIVVPLRGTFRAKAAVVRGWKLSVVDRLIRGAFVTPLLPLVCRMERRALTDPRVKHLVALSPWIETQLDEQLVSSEHKATIHRATPSYPEASIDQAQAEALRAKVARGLGVDIASKWVAFSPYKPALGEFESMVIAFKMLVDAGVDAVLFLACKTHYTYLPWIGELGLRDRVRFVGPSSRPHELIAAADLAVYPTSYDPGGWGLMSALKTQTPILTTTASDAAEHVRQRGGTVLDAPVDFQRLYEGLYQAIEHDSPSPVESPPPPSDPPLFEVIEALLAE